MLFFCRNGREVNPRENLSGMRVDPRDPRSVPNIGEDFPIDVLQLVHIHNRFASRVHFQRARQLKRNRVEVANLVRAVAQDQRFIIVREPPTFRVVSKFPNLPKTAKVIDKSFLREPRELVDLSMKNRQTLAKVLWREIDLLYDFAGLQGDFTQRRLARDTRAFIKKSAVILQSLREGVWVVRVCPHYVRAQDRDLSGVLGTSEPANKSRP